MKALFLRLALAALPALGEHQETLAPIALYTEFQQPPPLAVVDALQDEVSSIMAPTGLRFTWRDQSVAKDVEQWVKIATITFKGRCDAVGLSPHRSTPVPLGWTYISNGVILPFAEVDCQAISGFIQKELLAMPSEERRATYGRALGRVVAHELYHIFANTPRHSFRGAGKSAFTVRDLLSPKFQFKAHESLALRAIKEALEFDSFGRKVASATAQEKAR